MVKSNLCHRDVPLCFALLRDISGQAGYAAQSVHCKADMLLINISLAEFFVPLKAKNHKFASFSVKKCAI